MYSTHVSQGHNPSPANNYLSHIPNGHSTNHPPNPQPHHTPAPSSHRSNPPPASKEPVTVLGIPSVTVENNQLLVGNSHSTSTRTYTPLKVVGDGSFGTVWLCDWHGTLPPNTPMSAMQCGAGARPEYAGKRLVAVKRMKKRWEGGWDECKKLKELESLRAIPYHPNIIPLYDFFLLPATKELYFVFESMEGNLYQLIKTRKGKPLAGGLVSSIFQQVVEGLHHIHASGYFHRDMKPENLLVTTTGLFDYRPVSPNATQNVAPERDVVVIVKLADFGLARETRSRPPYTEYVSTRWYRAPEVLLKSRDYSNPVDMWALGTIMAELVNLRPLFPGQGEIDQVSRICELLGDPCDDYGMDARGKPVGGGKWSRGVKMAKAVGFAFPKVQPKDFYALFDPAVPIKLVECIADLLKYDPELRLNSRQCLEHPYLLETIPLNTLPGPPPQPPQTSLTVQHAYTKVSHRSGASVSRHIPPQHPHPSTHYKPEFQPSVPAATAHIPEASSSHRSSFYDSVYPSRPRALSEASSKPSDEYGRDIHNFVRPPDAVVEERRVSVDTQSSTYGSSVYSLGNDPISNPWSVQGQQPHWDAMDISPQGEIQQEHFGLSNQITDIQKSPMAREYPQRPLVEPEPIQEVTAHEISHSQGTKLGKLGALVGKRHSKWGLGGMFGHGDKGSQQVLPPVQENSVASAGSTPSLKRTQSSSTDSRSLSEFSPGNEALSNPVVMVDPKLAKEEAKRIARDAEKQRRLLAEKMHRDQARAVMEKQKRVAHAYGPSKDVQWLSTNPALLGVNPPYASHTHTLRDRDKGKHPAAAGPIRQTQSHGTTSKTISAAGGNFVNSSTDNTSRMDWRRDSEREPKARRREYDDDHSMSSSDIPSGVSVISFATVDSDPGPARVRHRPSAYGMNRMTSMSSLHGGTALDEFSLHARSSTSLSLEQQLVNDFHLRASVDSSSLSDGGSPQPPPMHMLSLSSPIPWQPPREPSSSQSTVDSGNLLARRQPDPANPMTLALPPTPRHPQQFQPAGPGSPYELAGSVYGHPPSPGVAPKSAINPIFKVPPIPGSVNRPGSLPPFAQLEAVADGEYPPLSPMSFTSPDEMSNDDS